MAALDRSLRKQLLQEIRDVLHETGTPAIYVTHDQEEAFTVADRLMILEGGNFLQNGTPDEVFHHPVSKKVAKFFGLINQVPGRVISTEHGLAVQTVIGVFSKVPGIAEMGIAGDLPQISLILRKASVMDLTNIQQKDNTFTAKVLDVQFSENGYKTTMEACGMRMEFMLEEFHPAGKMIQLLIDPSDINVFLE